MTQGQSQVNLLTIQKFAKMCGTTPKTLRLYERKGLFSPFMVNVENNYRFYKPEQAREFYNIKLIQNFHIPLNQILNTINNPSQVIDQKLSELQKEINEKKKELLFLKKIKKLTIEENYTNQLKKKTIGPFWTLVLHVEDTQYSKIFDHINTLKTFAKNQNLSTLPEELVYYLESSFNPTKTDLKIALVLKNKPNTLKLPENITIEHQPKVKVMMYRYQGPYTYQPLVYKKLYQLARKDRFLTNKPVFEKYIKKPTNTTSAYDYLTEIYFPIN